jgi:isopropylmalate/homocitrate/citramalate synthase
LPEKIILRDTTLREGIQMPGSHISLKQKQEFICLLHETGVPEIEIGLPDGISACLELADLIHEMRIPIRTTALIPFYTNRWKTQIDQAAEHKIDRIDILGPVSDPLLADPSLYQMTSQEIFPRLTQVLDYAKSKKMEISIGLIDATRTSLDRLVPLLRTVRDRGANRVVIYDSVGIMTPVAMKNFIASVHEAAKMQILVHCHNDYGMATANSLAAVEAGAEAIDVAINGVGGRAGNAALEEVALALMNLYGIETGVDATKFRALSTMTERLTGVKIANTKPIVGDFCFAHLPVMHIRCIAGGNPSAFEPYPPEQVGTQRTYHFTLPVDYTAALEPFVQKSGTALNPELKRQVLEILKKKEGVTEAEVVRIINQVAGEQQ